MVDMHQSSLERNEDRVFLGLKIRIFFLDSDPIELIAALNTGVESIRYDRFSQPSYSKALVLFLYRTFLTNLTIGLSKRCESLLYFWHGSVTFLEIVMTDYYESISSLNTQEVH